MRRGLGLYTDLTANLQVVLDWLGDYGLSDEEIALAHERITTVLEAIEDEEKTRRWQLRARVGKRVAWRNEVEGVVGETPIAIDWSEADEA